MTIEEIRKMCFDIAAAEGVVISAPIVLNGRLTRTLGRVCYAFDSPYDKTMHVKSIEFSKKYVENATDDEIRLTIIHEMTHAILCIRTGTKQGHNKLFKELCKQLGGDGETYAHTNAIQPKYVVTCECCGNTVKSAYRAGNVIKHLDWYKSGCCRSALTVKQNY